MMFIIRSPERPPPTFVDIKVVRRTPAIVAQGAGKTDYFCVGEGEDIGALRAGGWEIVDLRDGWYEDDAGGGIAIFGKYWEVRETPFTVKESFVPTKTMAGVAAASDEPVYVRGAVFGVPDAYPGGKQK
jgi:hypothetical protein